MMKIDKVKYLGDYIHENGKPNETISDRVARGYAIAAQTFSLLNDLHVGNLRAWLVNGIMFNSEVWHNVTSSQIAQLAEIDKYLLKGLVGAHSKVPVEHLYR